VTAASLFGRTNDALTARLRMEITRARQLTGLAIVPANGAFVAPDLGLLLPKAWAAGRADDRLQAVLADGEAWSPRALAAVLGESVRTVERRLADLGTASGVAAEGQGRARRYRAATRSVDTATRLLLLSRAPDV
jgi:hypothetical protein